MAKSPTQYNPEVNDLVLYRHSTNLVLSIGGIGSMQDVPLGSSEYRSHEPTVLLVNLIIVNHGLDHKLNSFRVPTRLVEFAGKWDATANAPAPKEPVIPLRDLIVEKMEEFQDGGITISQLNAMLERPSAAIHSSLQGLKSAGIVIQDEQMVWRLVKQPEA